MQNLFHLFKEANSSFPGKKTLTNTCIGSLNLHQVYLSLLLGLRIPAGLNCCCLLQRPQWAEHVQGISG